MSLLTTYKRRGEGQVSREEGKKKETRLERRGLMPQTSVVEKKKELSGECIAPTHNRSIFNPLVLTMGIPSFLAPRSL